MSGTKTVADFFAGIGLVSLGLGRAGWKTVYALDYDQEKADQYAVNFDGDHYVIKDVAREHGKNVPNVNLAHASFPCTDLSVAGARRGIYQGESSAFWHFVRILSEMKEKYGDENPNLVLLENVEGLLTSNSGKDLHAVIESLNKLGYKADLLRINASHFVPQSRVRIFIVGIHASLIEGYDQNDLRQEFSMRSSNTRPQKIVDYIHKNSDLDWYFHDLPNLPMRTMKLNELIDTSAEWWPEQRTALLLGQLHSYHEDLLATAKDSEEYLYYPAFRRMRVRDGKKQSTVELRTDGIAGCLRTPKGGSARQILVRAGKGTIDARLINGKEAALLMGADNFDIHPDFSLNQALFGFGDAVCVSVLEWIGENYFNSFVAVPESATELHELPVLGLQNQVA
jgi:DNA (cytosine-5)-methyltransferase 1